MIIYHSSWGLGNELFQYAFLRSIAKHEEKIYCLGGMDELADGFDLLDLNFYILSPHRYINFFIIRLFIPCLFWLAKMGLFNYYDHLENSKGISIKQINIKKGLIPINIIRTNFFQSKKYFFEKKIKLRIQKNHMQKALKVFNTFPKDRIKVFVHIRRGDYLQQTFNGKRSITLPVSYFNNAMNSIEEDIDLPFYIFLSDDPEYVEQAFRHLNESDKYISVNKPIVDFSLMTLCEYGIVSNSTFAWWGSYFMSNRKKVFFPKYWYGWKTKTESHPNIYPSWAKVIDVE